MSDIWTTISMYRSRTRVRVEPETVRMPGGDGSDQAMSPGLSFMKWSNLMGSVTSTNLLCIPSESESELFSGDTSERQSFTRTGETGP